MKNKKFDRRLALNKLTVVNLQNNEMTIIKGGVSEDTCPHKCPTPDPGTAQETWDPICFTGLSCTYGMTC